MKEEDKRRFISVGKYTDEDWYLIGIIAKMQSMTNEEFFKRALMEYLRKHKNETMKAISKITAILEEE